MMAIISENTTQFKDHIANFPTGCNQDADGELRSEVDHLQRELNNRNKVIEKQNDKISQLAKLRESDQQVHVLLHVEELKLQLDALKDQYC